MTDDWLLILVDEAARDQHGDDCRELTRAFATYLQQPVRLAFAPSVPWLPRPRAQPKARWYRRWCLRVPHP
jgi:hypothetical protein